MDATVVAASVAAEMVARTVVVLRGLEMMAVALVALVAKVELAEAMEGKEAGEASADLAVEETAWMAAVVVAMGMARQVAVMVVEMTGADKAGAWAGEIGVVGQKVATWEVKMEAVA